ncbi:NUDIX domain-containing protein [Candidatus Dependentiae bacterium]|nr:NUDIX domain-containing protein [Candidatus Dependentiae bacterium]
MFRLPCYVGIILTRGTEVFLVKRHHTEWASGQWNFPGGLLEEHEMLLSVKPKRKLVSS